MPATAPAIAVSAIRRPSSATTSPIRPAPSSHGAWNPNPHLPLSLSLEPPPVRCRRRVFVVTTVSDCPALHHHLQELRHVRLRHLPPSVQAGHLYITGIDCFVPSAVGASPANFGALCCSRQPTSLRELPWRASPLFPPCIDLKPRRILLPHRHVRGRAPPLLTARRGRRARVLHSPRAAGVCCRKAASAAPQTPVVALARRSLASPRRGLNCCSCCTVFCYYLPLLLLLLAAALLCCWQPHYSAYYCYSSRCLLVSLLTTAAVYDLLRSRPPLL